MLNMLELTLHVILLFTVSWMVYTYVGGKASDNMDDFCFNHVNCNDIDNES